MNTREPVAQQGPRDSTTTLPGVDTTLDQPTDSGQWRFDSPWWAGLDPEQIAREVARLHQRLRSVRRRWLAAHVDPLEAHLDRLEATGADPDQLDAARQRLHQLCTAIDAARAGDQAHAALEASERARAEDRRLRREGERR